MLKHCEIKIMKNEKSDMTILDLIFFLPFDWFNGAYETVSQIVFLIRHYIHSSKKSSAPSPLSTIYELH